MDKSFAIWFALMLAVIAGSGDAAAAQEAPVTDPARETLSKPGPEDPNRTRLLFGPTGRALKKGEVSFGVYEVVLPFVQVGITDRLSVGAGTPLLFVGDLDRPYWFTPKFKVVERGGTSAAVGAMHFLNVGDDASIGIAYGAVTHGNPDSSVTLGAGYAYARWDAEDYRVDDNAGAAVAMLGGERRVAKGVKLVTENYVFTAGGFASAGVRFFGGKLSADIGVMAPLGGDGLVVLPIINVVRKF